MNFWRDAFGWGWVTAEQLRDIVITDTFSYGEITKQEFEDITGESFDPVTKPEEVPVEDEVVPEEPAPKK